MPLADPELGGNCDLLLGTGSSGSVKWGSEVSCNNGLARVTPTLFGWVLSGDLPGEELPKTIFNIEVIQEDELSSYLQHL